MHAKEPVKSMENIGHRTKVGVKSSENCATGRTKLSAGRPYFTALLH